LPNYPGAQSTTLRTIPFPWIIYRGEYLKSDEEGSRLQIIKDKGFEFGVSGGFNFPIKSEENDARNGMPDTDALLGFGPSLIFRYPTESKLTRLTFGLGLRINYSIAPSFTFREQGFVAEPNIKYWHRPSKESPYTFFSRFSVAFADESYNNFFYGVKNEFETPTREAFDALSGVVDIGASLGFSVELTKNLFLFTSGFYSNLTLAANKESDLIEEHHNTGFIFGLSWMLFEKYL
tara:strand:- start:4602 stop:5306 length:705 start_codon:yes stop_codon:yes gene_type:complete